MAGAKGVVAGSGSSSDTATMCVVADASASVVCVASDTGSGNSAVVATHERVGASCDAAAAMSVGRARQWVVRAGGGTMRSMRASSETCRCAVSGGPIGIVRARQWVV